MRLATWPERASAASTPLGPVASFDGLADVVDAGEDGVSVMGLLLDSAAPVGADADEQLGWVNTVEDVDQAVNSA